MLSGFIHENVLLCLWVCTLLYALHVPTFPKCFVRIGEGPKAPRRKNKISAGVNAKAK